MEATNELRVGVLVMDRGGSDVTLDYARAKKKTLCVTEACRPRGRETTVSQLVGPGHPDLARMLAQIECQEIAKRGVAHGLPPANFSAPEPWLAWPRFIQVWLDRAMGKLLRFNTAALGRNFLPDLGFWGVAWPGRARVLHEGPPKPIQACSKLP